MEKQRQKQLVLASARGDKTAYAELIREFYQPVFGLCLAMVRNRHDAEDITQDVLLKGYIRIGQLREPEQFGSWIHTITRNQCNSFLSGKKETCEYKDEFLYRQEDNSKEEREHLHWAIGKLPLELRTPLILYYLQGKTLRAVADHLGASLTDIHRKVQCALGQLYQLLNEQGDKI